MLQNIKRRAAASILRTSIRIAMNMVGVNIVPVEIQNQKPVGKKEDAAFARAKMTKKSDVFAYLECMPGT